MRSMFKDKTGGGTEQSTKQGQYLLEVQSDKELTADQMVKLCILVADAVRLATGRGAFVVVVHR